MALKTNGVLMHASAWVNLENNMLSGQILYDSTPINYLEQANLQKQKVDSRLPGAGGGEHGELLLNRYRVSVWGEEKTCKE